MGESNEAAVFCCRTPLEFRLERGESWREHLIEEAKCSGCDTDYIRKPGKDFAYKREDDSYFCTIDGERIMTARVAHPIWDGPFEGAGSGHCAYESVPYCPKHEKEPNFHGKPIRVPMRADGSLDRRNLL